MEVWLQTFLISARDGGELRASRSGRFITAEISPLPIELGELQGRSGRFRLEKNCMPLPGIEPRFFCHSARSHYDD